MIERNEVSASSSEEFSKDDASMTDESLLSVMECMLPSRGSSCCCVRARDTSCWWRANSSGYRGRVKAASILGMNVKLTICWGVHSWSPCSSWEMRCLSHQSGGQSVARWWNSSLLSKQKRQIGEISAWMLCKWYRRLLCPVTALIYLPSVSLAH